MLRTAFLLPLALLAGCAAGGTQAVTLTSVPPGAACAVDRAGEHLGVVTLTPGVMPLYRSASPLEVTCSLPGYKTAVVIQPADATGVLSYAYPPVIQVALTSVSAGTPPGYVAGYAYGGVREASGVRQATRRSGPRHHAQTPRPRYASRLTRRRATYVRGYVPGTVIPGVPAPTEDYRRSPFVLRDPVAAHTAKY